MTSLTAKVSAAHDAAARFVADSYLRNLAKADTQFGTLEGLVSTFWIEVAAVVREAAAKSGVHNIRPRHDVVVSSARYLIAQTLRSDAALAAKLTAVREAQQAAEQARIAAEHASYEPLPIG